MANDIVLGSAMRSNLLSLQNTQKSIDSTQLRLATGKKVNSALDNPQSFFQAQSLTNRASDLTRLLDGIGQSIRSIEEADKGVTGLTNLVNQLDSVATEAQAELLAANGYATLIGTTDLRGKDLTDTGTGLADTNSFSITIQDEDINAGAAVTEAFTINTGDTVYDLAAKINNAVAIGDTNFSNNVRASVDKNGHLKIESLEEGATMRISSTSIGAQGFETLGLGNYVSTEPTVATTRQGGTVIAGNVLQSKASTAATVNDKYQASATLTAAGFIGTGDTVTASISIEGEAVSLGNLAGTDTIQSLVDKINNNGSLQGKVAASFNTDSGKIELTFGKDVGSAGIYFEATGAGDVVGFGFGTGAADATLAAATNVASESFRFVGVSADLEQYTKDFNKLREQIDSIVKDANYRGVNLLGGDNLTTYFNEDRSSTLVTEGQDLSVLGMGIDKAEFTDGAAVQKALDQVSSALETVRAFGSSLANDLSIIQTRQDFTNQTINTLKSGASDLTDADLNEEGANLLALQTSQQLGVTSLSLASQSQQAVLRLF